MGKKDANCHVDASDGSNHYTDNRLILPDSDDAQLLIDNVDQAISLNSMIQPNPGKYPTAMAPNEEIEAWVAGRFPKNRIRLSKDYGLVIYSPEKDVVDERISGSLPETVAKIDLARKAGKHVLYLPGSYDLVHKGHLLYVVQAMDFYIENANARGQKLTREDIFVVALADDDHLVRHVKGYKYSPDKKGGETFRRPINNIIDDMDEQERDPFEKEDARHPRLKTMASLPVDLAGFLPSQLVDTATLPAPKHLDTEQALARLDKAKGLETNVKRKIAGALINYEKLIAAWPVDNQSKISVDEIIGEVWSIELWQLYLNTLLFKDDRFPSAMFKPGSVTRIISAGDTNYLSTLEVLMEYSQVNHLIIDDISYVSTSKLIQEFIQKYGLEADKELRKLWAKNIREFRQ